MKKKINLAQYIMLRETIPANNQYYPKYIIILPRKWKEVEWWLT